ncbi:hypothetical protein SNEBB_000762 [Seison nebaliae]|nr:hypothetical protein SNEBB_000762 [Seison nebaliae]
MNGEIEEKKRKLLDDEKIEKDLLKNISEIKCINEDHRNNSLTWLCKSGDDSKEVQTIVRWKKKELNTNDLHTHLIHMKDDEEFKLIFHNDIFHQFSSDNIQSINNSIQSIIIHPADEQLIEKYSKKKKKLFLESWEFFEKFRQTAEYQQKLTLKWIDNIFEGKSERERIIERFQFSDRYKYIVLPDMKWEIKLEETERLEEERWKEIYCTIIFGGTSKIESLRDINGDEHLQLLEETQTNVKKLMKRRFGCDENELTYFIHYPPSFYQFHIHIVHINNEFGEQSIFRSAIPLSQVISNLKINKNYYQLVDFEYLLPVKDIRFNLREFGFDNEKE